MRRTSYSGCYSYVLQNYSPWDESYATIDHAVPLNIQNYCLGSSIRNCIAHINDENIVNKAVNAPIQTLSRRGEGGGGGGWGGPGPPGPSPKSATAKILS